MINLLLIELRHTFKSRGHIPGRGGGLRVVERPLDDGFGTGDEESRRSAGALHPEGHQYICGVLHPGRRGYGLSSARSTTGLVPGARRVGVAQVRYTPRGTNTSAACCTPGVGLRVVERLLDDGFVRVARRAGVAQGRYTPVSLCKNREATDLIYRCFARWSLMRMVLKGA